VAGQFTESKHPRGAGGLFAASAAVSGKPSGAWLSGPVRKGSGRKGARDPRVVAAQRQLNALGITDERGQPLLVDGIDGNHTTAAIKKWQRSRGLDPTGELDARSMVLLLSQNAAPKPRPTARSRMRAKPRSTAARKKPAVRAYADKGRGFSRMGPTAST